MTGRRAIAGLSLLCALAFCAIAAPSAFAATEGQTAFTCAPNTEGKGTFKDAHCDEAAAGNGKFTHKAISENSTGFTLTNAETEEATKKAAHATLKGILGGIASEITCKKVHGHGTLSNHLVGEEHFVEGEGTVDYTECTMPKPVNAEGKERCKVKEPIKFTAVSKTTKNVMGTLFSPKEGNTFVQIAFENGPGGSCPVAGKEVPVTGSAEATPPGGAAGASSATAVFTKEMTKGANCGKPEQTGLCLGGQPAEFESTITFRMLMTTEGAPENAITLTTPPFTADA
jgi:hypothetical protein